MKLGRTTDIDLRDVTVANVAAGSSPTMVTLSHLTAEVRLWSLFSGPLTIQSLSIDGAEVLLEHGNGDKPNWKFKTATAGLTPKEPNRVELPVLLDAHFRDVTIDFRTLSGTQLKTVIDDGAVSTAGPNNPVSLQVAGHYNSSPIDLTAALASFAELHDAGKPFPAKITIKSAGSTLIFAGTFTDPLDVDGANGMLTLAATSLLDLANIAGAGGAPDIPVNLSGAFAHKGGLWRLSAAGGALGGQTFKDSTLQLREGGPRQPDAVAVSGTFDTLDMNAILRPDAGAAPSNSSMSLVPDPAPGILLDATVSAAHVVYGSVQGVDFGLKAKTGPGTLSIEDFTLGVAGGTAKSKISIANKDTKAVVNFDGSLDGVDVAQLNKLLGWNSIPLGGPLTGRVTGSMIGATIAEARKTNRIFVAMAMTGGTIDRDLVRMASTDVRSLFGSQQGNRRLTCLLLIANLRDGTGTIGPLRIKTSSGTIAGSGTYDTVHDTIDLTIGAQSKSWLKLDVPMRVSGPLSNFSVRPAFGESARVLNDVSLPGDLPQQEKDIATANACLKP
jgi:AsmA family protein